ncbi:MAG: hypothetical protein GTO63_36140 [Anaerolineae bacterium]|nr:hypothetical protein [Anaerolineae bacterium]NIO00182.1 hypothetical protein [Anaerolineae bacterium]NIQ79626.1 hypothetical protein [Anaerolineae bacterium]
MTRFVERCSQGLLALLAVGLLVGCWPRTSKERLADDFKPTSLLDGYPYAVQKANQWSPKAFLEGASVGYRWQDHSWKPYGLSYVFVDAEQRESMLIVIRLDTRVAETNPPVQIEYSQVSTLPFFLLGNPVGEAEALEIAHKVLGDRVVLKCRNPEVTLRGRGFGEHQYWGLSYTAREPLWRVVGEVSVDAISGEVLTPEDLTHYCNE